MFILTIIIAYIIGSIPFGLLFTKLYKLGDIRNIGSGNVGATNALRTGNKKVALFTLLGDTLKGTIVVIIISFFTNNVAIILLHGIIAILGHIYSIFLKFKGGKGVATFMGVMLGFNYLLFLLFIGSWGLIAKFTKYASLSALVAIWICSFSAFFIYSNKIIFVYLVAISVFITFCHKANIKRLYNKQESKISLK